MKNAMQLKAVAKKISNEKKISAQLVLQNYMLERLLERISLSKYRDNFILKGGFLIASMVGLDTRATMDIDMTIKGAPVTSSNLELMIGEIIEISLDDSISFEFVDINLIRENDDYNGYRISLKANFPPMSVPLKIDLTTGDKITPKEIQFKYKTMMDTDKSISVLAYNLETIMAEKLETVLSRGDQSTRMRDYYDIYILWQLQNSNINSEHLNLALEETAKKRGSLELMKNYIKTIDAVKISKDMNKQWEVYQHKNEYAKDISFVENCDTIAEIMESIYLSGSEKLT
ncbi:putative nucleotidyltransferase component of viral defense system [Clostridiales Family XIII bacterium PM5-7]